MTKTITVSDETYQKIKDQIGGEKSQGIEIKKRYDSSVIYTSSKTTIKEAVEEAVEEGVNLKGANLQEANLQEANLRGASLKEADLRGVNFEGANLRGVNFEGANLRGADFREAKFYGKGGTSRLKKNQVEPFLKALGFIVED